MIDSGLERYFDCSGFYPAEVVPLRRYCGGYFDVERQYLRVEPDPMCDFVVYPAENSRDWHHDMVIEQMNQQIEYWRRCETTGPWYMQPESACPLACWGTRL